MLSADTLFYFEPAKLSQRPLINNWLAEPHIKEWVHGVGLQNTLNGLEKFFQGESSTTYWIGYDHVYQKVGFKIIRAQNENLGWFEYI